MSQEHIIKTVRQFNSEPVSAEDMKLLKEVAEDYRTVKNIVFERYSGIRSLPKLYPGYTVQNEMTESGIRQRMGLPSVYFYLAVFDALGSIKSEWTRLKGRVLKNINKHDNFTEDEKHYLRFVMKVDNAFEAVLGEEEILLSGELSAVYEELRAKVDDKRLNSYLRRQVRRHIKSIHGTVDDGFTTSERAYRYADHGIYLTTKKRRRRVFVPLTDHNCYASQLYVKLYPQEGNLEIRVPIKRKVDCHRDYTAQVGIALGMQTMLTTDQGHEYGVNFGEYQMAYSDWIRRQNVVHSQNVDAGRKKYNANKNRLVERLHSYINQELNRFFTEEKPQSIYVVKMPKPASHGGNGKINNAVSMWQRGYIKDRLRQKCAEQSVELVEVLGKDISRECSRCGAIGEKEKGMFQCGACGFSIEEKRNTAANALRRGQEGRIVRDSWAE